ncbi:translation initiation factor IF-2 N-terminal domain-containing protein, partial [Oscillospiraceae bacterium OttesenSCG-928-G22]|nr:translation initiation factor IF-2 N-terminal domain-containing protein [Oscillospiraceae bacterium OttesenSCG-928-G22]
MSSLTKYRVHEVAKDFKLTSKDISTILETYKTAPKNHMQALSDDELNLIFDYITLHNQVDDIDGTFAALKEQREKAAAEEELRKKAAAEKAAAEREAAEKAAAEK